MTDLRELLRSAADRYEESSLGLEDVARRSARRVLARRAAALSAGIAATALVILTVSQLGREPSEPQSPGPSPTPWITVIADDFENETFGSGWFEDEGSTYSLGLARGGYEIEIRRPLDIRYVVQTGGTAYDDVRVRVHLRVERDQSSSGSTGGYAGVLCVSRSDPADAYIFAVDPSDGVWVIQKITAGSLPVEQLGAGTFTSLGRQPIEVIGRCRAAASGTVALTLRAGDEVATATDPEGFSTFRGFGMYLASRGALVSAHFDDLALEIPPTFQDPRSPSPAG